MPNENENKKPEEQVKPEPQKQVPPTDKIDEFIKQVNEKGVSRAELERVKAERDQAIADRNKVMQSVLDGRELPKQTEKKSIAEYRKAYTEVIHKEGATNLEVAVAQMNLRDALMEAGEQDPCVPINGTEAEYATAEKVAQIKKECIAEAKGDPKKFNFLWSQHIADDDPALITALKRRSQKQKK